MTNNEPASRGVWLMVLVIEETYFNFSVHLTYIYFCVCIFSIAQSENSTVQDDLSGQLTSSLSDISHIGWHYI